MYLDKDLLSFSMYYIFLIIFFLHPFHFYNCNILGESYMSASDTAVVSSRVVVTCKEVRCVSSLEYEGYSETDV